MREKQNHQVIGKKLICNIVTLDRNSISKLLGLKWAKSVISGNYVTRYNSNNMMVCNNIKKYNDIYRVKNMRQVVGTESVGLASGKIILSIFSN